MSVIKSITEIVNRLEPQRLVAMGVVTLALIGFFAFVTTRVSTPNMGVLFNDLSMQDSNTIVKDLENRGIKYEVRQDGATILIPADNITRLRMEFAGKGLPAGGTVGYEVFDKADGFSATSFVQGINQLRALEGELSRTIKGIDRVLQARVHLAMPEKKLFDREKQEPRASIVLKTRGELDAGQIRAIRHLVATAVHGLKPDYISIIDENGTLLADGAGNDSDAGKIAEEKQAAYERRLKTQVEDIVASVVGRGRTKVQVSAELDFNKIQQVTDTYDPESKVVRSTQTRSENQQSQEARDNQVSVSKEIPQSSPNSGTQQKDATQVSEEITNFEISKTTKTEIIEGGRTKRLSVAVLVDGVYNTGANKQMEYKPRTSEEMERIATLVRSAIGFDKKRGDQVEVVNLRFAESAALAEIAENKPLSIIEQLLSFSKEEILRIIELTVLTLLTILVSLLVVRPLLRQILHPSANNVQNTQNISNSGLENSINNLSNTPLLPNISNLGADRSNIATIANTTKDNQIISSHNAQQANVNTIQTTLQQGALDNLGKFVQENPSETASVLRSWISQ